MSHYPTAARNFSPKTLRALTKAGVSLIGITALPDARGSFLNAETGYTVSDNGTGRVLTFKQVLEVAA